MSSSSRVDICKNVDGFGKSVGGPMRHERHSDRSDFFEKPYSNLYFTSGKCKKLGGKKKESSSFYTNLKSAVANCLTGKTEKSIDDSCKKTLKERVGLAYVVLEYYSKQIELQD